MAKQKSNGTKPFEKNRRTHGSPDTSGKGLTKNIQVHGSRERVEKPLRKGRHTDPNEH